MSKYLMLTAKKHRSWFNTCDPWEYESTSWRIFSDGSYRITLSFRPGLKPYRYKRKKYRRQSGVIPQTQFNKLLDLLKTEGWGEPDRKDVVCDGPMWEIRHFSPEGKIIGSSGKINFISGKDRPIDKIDECLPKPDESLFDLPIFPDYVTIENDCGVPPWLEELMKTNDE